MGNNNYFITEEQLETIDHNRRMFDLNAERIQELCVSEKDDIVYGFELGQIHSHLRECFMDMFELDNEIRNQQYKEPKINILTDLFIVYARTKDEAYNIQDKLTRLGFRGELKNDRFGCYYTGTVVVSNDERNGTKLIQWGNKEVEKSNQFKAALFTFDEFMAI